MSETLLLQTFKSNSKTLNLSNRKLEDVSKQIGKLSSVTQIDLKNNQLSMLPEEFGHLTQVDLVKPDL